MFDPKLAAHLARLQPTAASGPHSSRKKTMQQTTETGTVAFFHPVKRFGFVVPTGTDPQAKELHHFLGGHELTKCGIASLQKGDRLQYVVAPSTNGKAAEARDIKILD